MIKKCIGCGLLLPEEAYFADPKNISGLSGKCKPCFNVNHAVWTTQDELRHLRKLGRHARHTLGREKLLEAYLVIGEGRNWGSMDKDECMSLAKELLDIERTKPGG